MKHMIKLIHLSCLIAMVSKPLSLTAPRVHNPVIRRLAPLESYWKLLPLQSVLYNQLRFIQTNPDQMILKAFPPFAKATTDISFKQLLDPSKDPKVTISFLNTFVPQFAHDPVDHVEPHLNIPIIETDKAGGFIDLYVRSKSRAGYIVAMHASRRVFGDQRALFYACGTYFSQLTESAKKAYGYGWTSRLKPTIVLEVLGYDSNLPQGALRDFSFGEKQNALKLPPGKFIKHYAMTDPHSQQQLDQIQLIQIELPRYIARPLFPPQKDFTLLEWWLSLLRHSEEYTQAHLDQLKHNNINMPDVMETAFQRLNFSKWTPDQRKEYGFEVTDKKNFEVMYAVERAEGKEEGRAEGLAEGVSKGKKEVQIKMAQTMLNDRRPLPEIIKYTGLTEKELQEISKPRRK